MLLFPKGTAINFMVLQYGNLNVVMSTSNFDVGSLKEVTLSECFYLRVENAVGDNEHITQGH